MKAFKTKPAASQPAAKQQKGNTMPDTTTLAARPGSSSQDPKAPRRKYRRRVEQPKVPFSEIEPMVNLAKNKLKIREPEISSAIGLGGSTLSNWRSDDFAPLWFKHALQGWLLSKGLFEGQSSVPSSLTLQDSELELLASALGEYLTKRPSLAEGHKALRARLYRELALRLSRDA